MSRTISLIKNRNLWVLALFLLISLALHLIASNFQFNTIINGGDTDYPLLPLNEIFNSLSTWKAESFGSVEFFPISRFFLAIIPFINGLFLGLRSNILVFVVIWALAGYSMYLLLINLKFSTFVSVIVGLFYIINPYSYLRYHTPIIHIQLAYILLPLILYLFVRVVEKKTDLKKGTIIAALLMISISRTINLWSVYWLLIPIIVYLFKYLGVIEYRISLRKTLLFWLSALAINLVVLFMAIASATNFIDETQKNILISYYRESQIYISTQYKLIESLGGWGTYAWIKYLSVEKPGWQSFGVFNYISKFHLIWLSFIPPFFALISNLKKKRLLIVLIAVLFLILMNGFGSPFGNIYSQTLGNLPIYRDFFRDTWGYWGGIYIFFISLLLAFGFKDTFNNLRFSRLSFVEKILPITVLLIWITLTFTLYVYPGKIISSSWFVNIPQSYIELSNLLEHKERVLPVPLTSQPFGYTETTWGYKGPDILNRMSKVDLLDRHLNSIATTGYIHLSNEVVPTYESLAKILNKTGTNKVLLRKDFVDLDSKFSYQDFEKVLISSCFTKVYDSNEVALYTYKCNEKPLKLFSYSNLITLGNEGCYSNIFSTNSKNIDALSCYMPTRQNPKIIGDELLFEFNANKMNSLAQTELDQAYLNGIKLQNKQEVKLYENNQIKIDLSSGQFDLINEKVQDNSPLTCESNIGTDGIVFNKNLSSLGIISHEKQVCIRKKIKVLEGNGAVLKFAIRTEGISDSYIKIFSEKLKKDLYQIALGENTILNSDYILERYLEGKTATYYIYFNTIESFDDQTYLYLILNSQKKYFEGELLELRFVNLDKKIENTRFVSSDLDLIEENVSSINFSEILPNTVYKVYLNNKENVELVNFNTNFNSNWKMFGVKNGKLEIINDEKHILVNNLSNGWLIEDKNFDYLLVIYLPQIVYILGIIISLITLLTLLFLV